jgi:hypothetical protein
MEANIDKPSKSLLYKISRDKYSKMGDKIIFLFLKLIFDARQIRDDIHTPLERAVYWTEYVMRHPGAQHLQSPTRQVFQPLILGLRGIVVPPCYWYIAKQPPTKQVSKKAFLRRLFFTCVSGRIRTLDLGIIR